MRRMNIALTLLCPTLGEGVPVLSQVVFEGWLARDCELTSAIEVGHDWHLPATVVHRFANYCRVAWTAATLVLRSRAPEREADMRA